MITIMLAESYLQSMLFFFSFRLHRQPKHLLAFVFAELGTRYVCGIGDVTTAVANIFCPCIVSSARHIVLEFYCLKACKGISVCYGSYKVENIP